MYEITEPTESLEDLVFELWCAEDESAQLPELDFEIILIEAE